MSHYFDLYERFQISEGHSKSTKIYYRTLQRTFGKYEREKKEQIDLATFGEIKHSKFVEWCIYEKENIPSTVMKRNGLIKTFFAFCERNGATVHPFYQSIKSKTLNPEMVFLTESELKKIEDVEVDSYFRKNKRLFSFFLLYRIALFGYKSP